MAKELIPDGNTEMVMRVFKQEGFVTMEICHDKAIGKTMRENAWGEHSIQGSDVLVHVVFPRESDTISKSIATLLCVRWMSGNYLNVNLQE